MRQLIKLTEDLADVFDRVGLAYAIGGALASNYWGIVRATVDVDCLVAIPALKYEMLASDLIASGYQMHDPSGNEVEVTVAQMRQQADQDKFIEVFREAIRVEMFVPIVPLQQELLRRAITLPLESRDIKITTAEDLILIKLAFHRAKDIQDVSGILWVQRGKLDLDYLLAWSTKTLDTNTQAELQELIEQYAAGSE